jgi:hypothetical protein
MSFVRVPVRLHGGDRWGCLQTLDSGTHQFVGFDIWQKKEQFSFIDGHRVRLYAAKGMVHFRVPTATQLIDISGVTPASQPPPRRQGR